MKKYLIFLTVALATLALTACEGGRRTVAPGSACTTNDQCSDGQSCQDGVCLDTSKPKDECSTDSDCNTGYHCELSEVSCNGITCTASYKACKADDAQPTCSADADCGSDKSCSAGVCVNKTTPTPTTKPVDFVTKNLAGVTCFSDKEYSATITAKGGSGNYQWDVDDLGWLEFDENESSKKLTIHGKPTICTPGKLQLAVTVKDASDAVNNFKTTIFEIDMAVDPIKLDTLECSFAIDKSSTCTLNITGGSGTYSAPTLSAGSILPAEFKFAQGADAKSVVFTYTPPADPIAGESKIKMNICDAGIANYCSGDVEIVLDVDDIAHIKAFKSEYNSNKGVPSFKELESTSNITSGTFKKKSGYGKEKLQLQAYGFDDIMEDKVTWTIDNDAVKLADPKHKYGLFVNIAPDPEKYKDGEKINFTVTAKNSKGKEAKITFANAIFNYQAMSCNTKPRLYVGDTNELLKDYLARPENKKKTVVTFGDELESKAPWNSIKIAGGSGFYTVDVEADEQGSAQLRKEDWSFEKVTDEGTSYSLAGQFVYTFDKSYVEKTVNSQDITSKVKIIVTDEVCSSFDGYEPTEETVKFNVHIPMPNDATEEAGSFQNLFKVDKLRAIGVVTVDDDCSDDKIWIRMYDKNDDLIGMPPHIHPDGESIITSGGWIKNVINNFVEEPDDSTKWSGDIRDIFYVGYKVWDECTNIFCYEIDFNFHSIVLVTQYYYLYVFDKWDAKGEGTKTYNCPVGQATGPADDACDGQIFKWRLRCEPGSKDLPKGETTICGQNFTNKD